MEEYCISRCWLFVYIKKNCDILECKKNQSKIKWSKTRRDKCGTQTRESPGFEKCCTSYLMGCNLLSTPYSWWCFSIKKAQVINQYRINYCTHSLINLLLASIIQIRDSRWHFLGTLTYDNSVVRINNTVATTSNVNESHRLRETLGIMGYFCLYNTVTS